MKTLSWSGSAEYTGESHKGLQGHVIIVFLLSKW